MSAGLYSREVVATFLGKRVEEIERMIEEDGLPAVPVPGDKRQRYKFGATQLTAWLNKRSKGARWTVDEVIAELARCAPDKGRDSAVEALAKVQELRDLCEVAERSYRRGLRCAKIESAIVQVASELKDGREAA